MSWLVYKLAPLDDKMRKLGHVRKLWDQIMDISVVRDVFKDEPIRKEAYEVDHFIPWSFVMNDELWNLVSVYALAWQQGYEGWKI